MRTTKDNEEQDLLEALDKEKLKKSKNASEEMRMAEEAAGQYMKKDARINIRLSGPDLKLLKRRAAEEGIPYQTLIASILHKFVTGRLSNAS